MFSSSQISEYFKNIAAVVTGGASGIGLATAEAFMSAGAYVIVVDRDKARLDAAAAQVGCAKMCGDISQWDVCLAIAAKARDCGRPLRALVNCAASFLAKGKEASPEDWDLSLGINVKGTALMASALSEVIRDAGGGAIVNMASISGHVAQPNRWTYNASKGAIISLTRCQALDFATDNIRVNSISPGTVWTPELDRMTNGNRTSWEPVFAQHHMLNRVGEPSEVALVALFLCSPASSFMTGSDVLVDGGYVGMGHERSDDAVPYSRHE